MNQDQMLQTAKNMVEAAFDEFVLWSHASPLEWASYMRLLKSIAVSKLHTSSLSLEEKMLAATQPFWSSVSSTDTLRKVYEEILVDKDLQSLIKQAMDSVGEQP